MIGALLSPQVLDSGRVDPDSRDGEGTTPLMLAAAAGHMDVLTTLLEEGADPNIRCNIRVIGGLG